MAVLGLVLPSFTMSSPGPTLSPLQSTFLIPMSLGLYGVFLGIQTRHHRDYFVSMSAAESDGERPRCGEAWRACASVCEISRSAVAGVCPCHCSPGQTNRGVSIDYGISVLDAPAALGGLLVAVLILFPESLSAGRAAWANQLQRCINLALETALSSISLTIPAILLIGLVTGKTIILDLDTTDMVCCC